MALVALAAEPDGAGAGWQAEWPELLQHRFGGSGALAGHPVGNLLLTGLLEEHADPVAALDAAGSMIGAVGRVLPMSALPLDLVADVATFDRDDPVRVRRIRGQSAIAATPGHVRDIRLIPADAPACPAAVEAVETADAIVLGPGSWFTSVIPHLLLPGLAAALSGSAARVVVTLNLVPQPGETEGFSATEYLNALERYAPALHVDAVVADPDSVPNDAELAAYCGQRRADLVMARVSGDDAWDRHDPARLATALTKALGTILDAGSATRADGDGA
jgi:uncharacterized cofD-like protein